MSIDAYRWEMTAVNEPMVRTAFDATPGAGEVTVEVAGCGVCHTDLGYLYDGVRTNMPLPLALGHEISGRVVAAGAGAESWVGKAVLIPAVTPCGDCDLCNRGLSTICRGQKMPGNDVQGGFGSHIVVSQVGLCPVDEARLSGAGLELADISVVADAVTTPYKAVLQADVKEGDLAVVVGVGGVGGYAVQIAAAFGAKVVAIDIDESKLAKMREYGAAQTFNGRELSGRDLRKAVQGFAKENGLRATEWKLFECSGTSAGQKTAFGLLTFGAHLAVVGFTMDTVELRLSNLMAFHAKAQGNWGCETTRYPDALDLVLDRRIQLAPFIERHPMDEINEIFAQVHAHELQRRAILVPGA